MPAKRRRRELDPFEHHAYVIARKTLKMNDVMVAVMGGPNKSAARAIIRHIKGKEAGQREINRLEGKR